MKKIKNKFTLTITIVFLINYYWSFLYISNYTIVSASNDIVRKVNPIGRAVGLKLYTNGVLVVGMSELENVYGELVKPYDNTGIKEGDLIKEINGKELKNVSELIDIVNNSNGNDVSIKYERNNDDIYTTIKPVKVDSENYMLGLWVRDAAAGIGTLTFYEESSGNFAALGHGIEDIDTGNILNISNGEIVTSKIISIVKGNNNRPGEIRGTIDEGEKVGQIKSNNQLGVYGEVTNFDYINSVKLPEVSVANREQIKIGNAKIVCQLSNTGIEEFEIEIKKIFRSNVKDNKSMLIKVNDSKLIEKTGGIIPRNEWNTYYSGR
ncbi:MAG: PDZ domain-containing protein [Clostridia bacterium]|nr:PDZ domain-containing protein [Clostridia bacterium]